MKTCNILNNWMSPDETLGVIDGQVASARNRAALRAKIDQWAEN
ncbi:MAG: hypothetical protein WCF23_05765 [Candidatus Nitrosopolaris sp.]